MTKLMKGKLIGIGVACLLVASLVVAGATAPATTAALADPSVSIVPGTQEVAAGGSFSVDVEVDSAAFLVKGCGVKVTFDANLTATAATGYDLLGAPVLAVPTTPGIAVGEVTWDVVRLSGNDPAAVAGDFMTIDFDVAAVAAGTYPLTIEAILVDENNQEIVGVVLNHGEVVVPGEVPGAPSVSIDPGTQTVAPGGTFTVDVEVDSAGLLVKGCEVTVTFDALLTATDATGLPLLGAPVLANPTTPGIAVGEVTWAVVRTGDNDPAAVAGDFMSIDFNVDPAAAGTYDLIIDAMLVGADGLAIPGVVEIDGEVVVPVVGAPSVSIDPETQMVAAGDSFSVDVVVDSEAFLVKGCEVTVTFDALLTATDATGLALLGAPVLANPTTPGIAVGEVTWAVVRTGDNDPAAVAGDFMTIDFDVDPAAVEGTIYALTIEAMLVGADGLAIPGVVENDGEIVIGALEFEETFVGTLAEGLRAYICTIPEGATELDIDLTTAASPGPDMDLELYDEATKVIGDGGVIDSAPDGTYDGDYFRYSGYDGGEEEITAAGPLSQSYDLKVYAYEAGTYTVDVFYVMPGPDNDPPTIAIDAPDGTVGVPTTITVSATDPSGVAYISFGVWDDDYVLTGTLADWNESIADASAPGGEVSLTFTPSSANSYYVAAWSGDMVGNSTPDLDPETVDWEVT